MKALPVLAALFALTLPAAAQSAPAMPMAAKPPVTPAQHLTVVTNAAEFPLTPRTFTIPMLQALPQQTITATDGHTGKSVTFTGPLVADVFGATGLSLSEKTHSLLLRGLVIAQGTDKYRVVYSMAELQPGFSNSKVIIALTADGQPVASGIQIVDPNDIKPARWVHGLTVLAFSAVPLEK